MPPPSPVAARRDHLIVCGEDALARRVVEELTTRYGQSVTVLLRSKDQGLGPQIASLPRVRVIERAELNSDAFTAAQAGSAGALALLGQDDLGNFHAALRAQELNPELRLVVRIFNTRLGERMNTFFTDCAVLSGSSMAAPSFAAAALGEPATGSDLAGRPVKDVHQTGQVRVIALWRPGTDRVDWSPGRQRLIAPQDRIYVLATRAGLSSVLARSQPAQA